MIVEATMQNQPLIYWTETWFTKHPSCCRFFNNLKTPSKNDAKQASNPFQRNGCCLPPSPLLKFLIYLDSTTCRSPPASSKTLEISRCKNLELPLPHSHHCLNLTELCIDNCENLITSEMSGNLQGLPSLTKFTISGFGCRTNLESFPSEGLLPSTITRLHISYLERFNVGFQQLTSLTSLLISNCPKLHTIPEEGFPHTLKGFGIPSIIINGADIKMFVNKPTLS